ncbi:MAG: response regulator [Gemmatimonadota bacterium]
MVPIRVVAVEDDLRYRASLEALFRSSPDFTFLAGFSSARAALAEIQPGSGNGHPGWDLVLMDLDLPEMGGIECTRHLKASLPDTSVVILTVFEDRVSIVQAICAGADGYLLKSTPADRILERLKSMVSGGAPLSAGVARTVLEVMRDVGASPALSEGAPTGASEVRLTQREQEVLRALIQGMSYKMVAHHLGISLDTVRDHVRNVYAKLQVHSVAEAVGRALRERLV